MAVLLGGDLLPHRLASYGKWPEENFIPAIIQSGFAELKEQLLTSYPRVFLILGNDDPRSEEANLIEGEAQGLWSYIHNRRVSIGDYTIYGYACVAPTPFMLKDWERYDVSRFVDPGCISPEEGWRSMPIPSNESCNDTIKSDLEKLTRQADLSRSVFLFHSPPHRTALDRADLDGKMIDNVPLDVHAGSIAIRRFIEARQPWITLHGHIHESARLTGSWRECLGRTYSFSAAHDGTELALVRFDPAEPEKATRELI